jgi:hypothetical protein
MGSERLIAFLKPLPQQTPIWRDIVPLILSVRDAIQQTEQSSESTQMVELRNCLEGSSPLIKRLRLTPPQWKGDIPAYLQTVHTWILEFVSTLI